MKHGTLCLSLAAALGCPLAEATTQLVGLTGLNSSTTTTGFFQGNESLLVNTLVTGATGALSNTVFFTVGAGVTSLSGAAAWEIGTAAGADPRLVGVNIDIFDFNNVLVASDTSVLTANGFAASTLSGAITPGTYKMVMTGTGVRTSSLDVSLSFAGAASVQPAPMPTGVLLQSSTLADPVGAGDTVLLDTSVIGRTGALRQTVTFTAGAGVTGFTAREAWEVTSAVDTGPRLVGVNVDLFDAANNLVLSDSGVSVINGFATSSFAGALDAGTYTLVVTGTAVRDVMLDVSLTLTGAQVTAVPEPESYALLLAGLGVLAGVARRRRFARH